MLDQNRKILKNYSLFLSKFSCFILGTTRTHSSAVLIVKINTKTVADLVNKIKGCVAGLEWSQLAGGSMV